MPGLHISRHIQTRSAGSACSVLDNDRQSIPDELSTRYALLAVSASCTAQFLEQEGGFQSIPVSASWGSVRPAGHAVNNIWQQFQSLPTPDLGQLLCSVLRVIATLWHQDVTWRLLELTQLSNIVVVTCRNVCILSSGFLLQKFIAGRFKCSSPEKASSH